MGVSFVARPGRSLVKTQPKRLSGCFRRSGADLIRARRIMKMNFFKMTPDICLRYRHLNLKAVYQGEGTGKNSKSR